MKIKAAKSPSNRTKILSACSSNGIKITKLLDVDDGYMLWCASVDDLDKLFDRKIQTVFCALSVKCVVPPQLRAKRSVIIRRIDSLIYDHTEDEIITEIKNKNSWADVVDIYKFPNSRTLKIQFISSSIAERCIASGLSMFYLHVGGNDMSADEFIPVLTCYRCYSLEDHITSKCPKDESFRVCSVCACIDHTWRDCKSLIKKCLNCGGNHNALSMQCPHRRAVIKSKRSEHKDSHKDVVNRPPRLRTGGAVLESQVTAKSVSCIFLALLESSDGSTDFSDSVNKLLSMNDLPTLNLTGFKIDPAVVLRNFSGSVGAPMAPDTGCGAPSPASALASDVPSPAAALSSDIPSSGDSSASASPSNKQHVFKFFKSKGTIIKTTNDLLNAYDGGKVVITSVDGNAIDYSTAVKVIKSCKSDIPKIVEMKSSDFDSLCASPGRYLRGRSTRK